MAGHRSPARWPRRRFASALVAVLALLTGLVTITAPAALAGTWVVVNDVAGSAGNIRVEYSGTWHVGEGPDKYGGDDHYSDRTGALATVRFTGTGVSVFGARAPWHGVAGYSVDGGPEHRVDMYAPTRADQQAILTVTGLSAAPHIVRVRVTGDRRPASAGPWISVDKIVVSVTPDLRGQFVTRAGSTLQVAGQPFRFTGTNMYWLGLDDNITDGGGPTYPTKARIDNALRAAADAGMTVIRAHTLGISVGCARCFEPRLGAFHDSALDSADYALMRARQLGLRVMVPLTDQWRHYHGGISVFTGWRGYQNVDASTDNRVNAANNRQQRDAESHFYTDPAVITDFRQYVTHLLNHVNRYTGTAWKDDSTILAWETGNEIWTANPPWTQSLASFIKHELGARQLVADGTAATGMHVADAAIHATDIDIVGGHFYPIDVDWAAHDAADAAAAGKAYIIGEYGWPDVDATRALLSTVEGNTAISGAMLWTMLPYQEDGRPEPHEDGYAFYNPAVSPANAVVLDMIRGHAAAINPD